jgi:hypothetical protein
MTMRDDYLSAEWAGGHHQVSAAIHKAISMVAESFDRLHAYQYDAPWQKQPQPRTGAGR